MQSSQALFTFMRMSVFTLLLAFFIVACGQDADAGQNTVTSHLSGEITLNAEIDSTADYSGFEIIVGQSTEADFDTLAIGVTDAAGQFSMTVQVPRTNIYTLILARAGSILRVDEIAIAEGDSASFKVEFPFGNRPLMIRSNENAALIGYKNTMALHNSELSKLAQDGVNDRSVYEARINQTSAILWSLRDTSPNTLAAMLGSAQSILLLEGWNDSLLVDRVNQLEADNVNYGSVAGAARRAQMRLNGPDAAIAIIEGMKTKSSDSLTLAALQSELVLAYRDAQQADKALDAARALKMQYATDSTWIRWADRAIFDLEYLQPGMDAPTFNVVDTDGNTANLARFSGKYVVLEFYAPGQDFERELNARNAFFRADSEEQQFEILSVSVQSDTLMNEAFFDGRDFPGTHVFLPDGPDASILDAYNVYLLPTRYIIDPEGKLAGKYVLENGTNAFQDVLTLALSADSN